MFSFHSSGASGFVEVFWSSQLDFEELDTGGSEGRAGVRRERGERIDKDGRSESTRTQVRDFLQGFFGRRIEPGLVVAGSFSFLSLEVGASPIRFTSNNGSFCCPRTGRALELLINIHFFSRHLLVTPNISKIESILQCWRVTGDLQTGG